MAVWNMKVNDFNLAQPAPAKVQGAQCIRNTQFRVLKQCEARIAHGNGQWVSVEIIALFLLRKDD
jgi:hypothetical protein